MKNIFEPTTTTELVSRIDNVTDNTKPKWGKMSAAQMFAHCSVPYELAYDERMPKAKGLKRFLMKTFLKPIVVGGKPYKKMAEPHLNLS